MGWSNLAVTYTSLKRYDDAVAACQKAIELYPNFSLAWNTLGNVYYTMGKKQNAVEAYEKIISIDKNYIYAGSVKSFV